MIDLKALFLSPRGRVGRQTFLLAVVLLVAANIVFGLIPFLGPVVALPLLWPMTCVTAKRLHDAGRSAMPAYLVGVFGLATGAAAAAIGIMATDTGLAAPAFALAGVVLLASGLSGIAALALLAFAALARGDAAANRFGPPEAAPLTLRHFTNDGTA